MNYFAYAMVDTLQTSRYSQNKCTYFLFVKKVRNDEQCVQKKSKRKKLGFTAAVIIAQIVERKKFCSFLHILNKLCILCTC